jgi:hypothetical protein
VLRPKTELRWALSDAVCSGSVSLTAAQHAIATDWITAGRLLRIRAVIQGRHATLQPTGGIMKLDNKITEEKMNMTQAEYEARLEFVRKTAAVLEREALRAFAENRRPSGNNQEPYK